MIKIQDFTTEAVQLRVQPASCKASQEDRELIERPALSMDREGECTYLNQRFRKLFHIESFQGLNLNWRQLVHPDDIRRVESFLKKLKSSKGNGLLQEIVRMCTFEEKQPWAYYTWSGFPQFSPAGEFVGYIFSFDFFSFEDEETRGKRPKLYTDTTCPKTKHPRRMPTVTFKVDGVLANITQRMLDHRVLTGIGDSGEYDWRKYNTSVLDACSYCPFLRTDDSLRRLEASVSRDEYLWSTLEPFPDIDFEFINNGMAQGDYVGHFIGSRFFLDTPGRNGDPRYLTRLWLQDRGIRDAQSVETDICASKRPWHMRSIGTDYALTDDPDLFLEARILGIQTFLIDRPWNHDLETGLRVSSPQEFLERTVYETHSYTNNR